MQMHLASFGDGTWGIYQTVCNFDCQISSVLSFFYACIMKHHETITNPIHAYTQWFSRENHWDANDRVLHRCFAPLLFVELGAPSECSQVQMTRDFHSIPRAEIRRNFHAHIRRKLNFAVLRRTSPYFACFTESAMSLPSAKT
jgi:hypothetical protein